MNCHNNDPHHINHELHKIHEEICAIRQEQYDQQIKQYAYDRSFSDYVESQLQSINIKQETFATDINSKLKKLEENVKNGSIIPQILKSTINNLI